MTTKCTGIMGRIFGHKFVEEFIYNKNSAGLLVGTMTYCKRCGVEPGRCGAVTGEKK